MAETFKCPYLNDPVELTREREEHVTARHPDLLPVHRGCIAETLKEPEKVRPSPRFKNALMFTRWFPNVRGGRFVIVVVVSDVGVQTRHWIVTAYMTKRLAEREA